MDFKLQKFEIPMEVTSFANVHYFEFTKEFHSKENSHDFCEILYVDSGQIEVRSEFFKGILCENELIIHRPGAFPPPRSLPPWARPDKPASPRGRE